MTVRRKTNTDGKLDNELTVDDVIEIHWDNGRRIPRFPTLCICTGCNGMKSLYVHGRNIENPALAYHVALVEYGHAAIGIYDNLAPRQACNCVDKLIELKSQIPKIIRDTGWVNVVETSRPERGIRDYAREIIFVVPLSDDLVKVVQAWLERDKCPGWTGVNIRALGENRYRCFTTYDSSD